MIPDDVDGITLTGGEPQEQLEEVVELCKRYNKSIVLFTGKEEVDPELAKHIDLAIVGPFLIDELDDSRPYISSQNQRLEFFSQTYGIDDLKPVVREFIIDSNGDVVLTGIQGKEG